MTRNHRAAVFTPITWEVMYERVRGPLRRPLDSLHMLAYHQACKISHIM